MTPLLLLAGISLALSLFLIPISRNAALRWNLVDVPDTTRKFHRCPIPRIGGLPVALAAVCSFLIVAALSARYGIAANSAFSAAKTVAPAALFVFCVGLADDLLGLKPWQKLAGQVLAGVIAVAAGVQIHFVGGLTLHPWLGAILTVIWLVGCSNAVNLIDGVDGLAAGIGLLACATTLVAAWLSGNIGLAVAVAPLAGALAGFLFFNFNPASIFLGDCGSLVIGFLLGCYGILWSDKSAATAGMTAPLIALTVPLLDTTLAITRRFLRRKPIFDADRSHIHHRLLARGFTARTVALLLYMAAGIAGMLALFLSRVRHPWDAVILAAFVCVTLAGVKQLQYVEFDAARRLMLSDAFRRTLNGQIAVKGFETGLSLAVTPQDCWAVIETASKDFGFHRIEMRFAGQLFSCHSGAEPIRSWDIRIPISSEDWIELSHEFGPAGHATAVVAFAETIRKVLMPRTSLVRQSESNIAAPPLWQPSATDTDPTWRHKRMNQNSAGYSTKGIEIRG
jgi:UDP-GlcNAc:undecaprenyl-phosphate GlcNAc-1-phosphate transferase